MIEKNCLQKLQTRLLEIFTARDTSKQKGKAERLLTSKNTKMTPLLLSSIEFFEKRGLRNELERRLGECFRGDSYLRRILEVTLNLPLGEVS